MVQWLTLHASTAGGVGSIPGQGATIRRSYMLHGATKIKQTNKPKSWSPEKLELFRVTHGASSRGSFLLGPLMTHSYFMPVCIIIVTSRVSHHKLCALLGQDYTMKYRILENLEESLNTYEYESKYLIEMNRGGKGEGDGTLAWKIPWAEETGRLQSMGLLRVGHYWATSIRFLLSRTGEGNGNPLQGSCLENPSDRGAWWAAICGVARIRTWLKRLSSSSSSGREGKLMQGIESCGPWSRKELDMT